MVPDAHLALDEIWRFPEKVDERFVGTKSECASILSTELKTRKKSAHWATQQRVKNVDAAVPKVQA